MNWKLQTDSGSAIMYISRMFWWIQWHANLKLTIAWGFTEPHFMFCCCPCASIARSGSFCTCTGTVGAWPGRPFYEFIKNQLKIQENNIGFSFLQHGKIRNKNRKIIVEWIPNKQPTFIAFDSLLWNKSFLIGVFLFDHIFESHNMVHYLFHRYPIILKFLTVSRRLDKNTSENSVTNKTQIFGVHSTFYVDCLPVSTHSFFSSLHISETNASRAQLA